MLNVIFKNGVLIIPMWHDSRVPLKCVYYASKYTGKDGL